MGLFNDVAHRTEQFSIKVNQQEFSVIGASIYFLAEDPTERYVKLFLPEHRVLAFGPTDEEAIFAQAVGKITDAYPASDLITYNGKSYKKQYRAYQRVEQLLFGDPNLVEGEVDFTDYECIEDAQLVLSIGPISYRLRRDDVAGTLVPIKSIKIENKTP